MNMFTFKFEYVEVITSGISSRAQGTLQQTRAFRFQMSGNLYPNITGVIYNHGNSIYSARYPSELILLFFILKPNKNKPQPVTSLYIFSSDLTITILLCRTRLQSNENHTATNIFIAVVTLIENAHLSR